MPACTWECTPTSPPRATRSCRYPTCVVRMEWVPDPRCRAGDRALRLRVRLPLPSLLPSPSARLSPQVIAAAFFAQKLPAIHDHFSTRYHRARVAFYLKTLEHRI